MEQECLQDYIKLSQNIKIPKNGHTKVESIITTSEKKKGCEDRAMKIVELLLEGSVRVETFLKSISYLNSTYYQDIVEERSIAKTCGYPLCGKKLKTVSKKRYSISTKNNKVYDLNEYGYFCSIYCFNASNHIKNQIDDSPLWLRDFQDIPTFSLLQKNEGHLSRGVNLKSKVISVGDGDFVPVASFAEISLNDFIQFEDTVNDDSKHFKLDTVETEELCKTKNYQDLKKAKQKLETVIEDDVQDNMKTDQIYEIKGKNINEKLNEVIVFIERSNENLNGASSSGDLNESLMSKLIKKTYLNETNIEQKATECNEKSGQYNSDEKSAQVENNLTTNSVTYSIQASERLKKSLSLKDLNEKIKNKFTKPIMKLIDPLPLKTKTFEVKKSIEKQYIQENTEEFVLEDSSLLKLKFSQKNSLEVESQIINSVRKWISLDTLIFIHGENTIKAILNGKKLNEYYNKLKISQLEVTRQQKYISICKRLQLQELSEQKWDSEFTSLDKLQTIPDFSDLKQKKHELDIKVKHFLGGMLYEADDGNFPLKETQEKEEEGVPAVLPLVDVNSQNALRRRVLLGALNKSVKFFLDVIKCYSISISTELQDLVKTFKLSADNVVFNPIVSDYQGFICMKILALKDAQVKDLLRTRLAIEYENLILNLLPGKNEVVHKCLDLIENVDIFIENHFSFKI